MQRLGPVGGPATDAEIADWYAFGEGATLRSNMIMTADGVAVGSDGVSKSLGGPADGRLLGLLRALADAVIVAAGTIRAERYRPLRTRDELLPLRAALGLPPHPRLVMVTRETAVDESYDTLAGCPVRPLVLCARDTGALAAVADVVELPGPHRVDLAAAKEHLVGLGMRRLHTEGGPMLLAGFLAAGLLDEYCLTIAPTVLGGREVLRPVMGAVPPTGFDLVGCATADGFLFLRYRARA